MSKKMAVMAAMLVVMFGVNAIVLAATAIGNTICPVTGEKINDKAKATYEYQGKIYNFCCPMCVDRFKKEPDKYIKKINEGQEKNADGKGHP